MNSSTDTSPAFSLSTQQRIAIYGGIVVFSIALIILRVVLYYLVMLAASRSLHGKMFKAALRAPVLFFDTNPVGKYSYIYKQLIVHDLPNTNIHTLAIT